MNRLLMVMVGLCALTLVGWAQGVDMGDLPACDYPTLVNNPGHTLSDVAWLGECITAEAAPQALDQDGCDDGVTFLGAPWTPCAPAQVQVVVTGGSLYPLYQLQNGRLYLNAWKDGNLDGDFCDVLCPGAAGPGAPEWIIRDSVVTPGTWLFTFVDPGVTDIGVYDGVFRFRLTGQPVGPEGFGLVDNIACRNMLCGNFGYEHLGEVEDYIITDLQLFVELGTFDAVSENGRIALRWSTRSEAGNDRFEILRDGARVGDVESLGDTPTGHRYSWTDYGVESGVVYTYTLVSVNLDGSRETLGTVAASLSDHVGAVTEYALYQNYPNPFNPTTTIAFDLAEAGEVTLTIYNLQGQEIATIIRGQMAVGAHTAVFDASGLPSGMYWYKLTANDFTAVRKMMLMK
ncbi:T9SS type A sorting domain-containing protein [bacterium]|nr:T9SS type A sorting domain-containing protein [bacterium]MBU1983534.1 T9SS type A sorting domain-containing protein [bacterium]